MSLIIFAILWSIRKQIKVPGVLFFIYLIFNGLERFFIEKIRINTEYNILGGITQAEIISFCLVLIGLLGWMILYKNNKREIYNK
jgi:phosphatidylglycerol:prolipoprotein diacylglycerol transferase